MIPVFLLAASSLGGGESTCVAMGMVAWLGCVDRPCAIWPLAQLLQWLPSYLDFCRAALLSPGLPALIARHTLRAAAERTFWLWKLKSRVRPSCHQLTSSPKLAVGKHYGAVVKELHVMNIW